MPVKCESGKVFAAMESENVGMAVVPGLFYSLRQLNQYWLLVFWFHR